MVRLCSSGLGAAAGMHGDSWKAGASKQKLVGTAVHTLISSYRAA